MPDSIRIVKADDGLWQQYSDLSTRSYGHPVGDITRLRPYADIRVALRGDRVIAGGLGLLGHQFFGGAPVPSALLSAGCVAPEERGTHLSVRMITERLRPLRDQGAVLSTLWSSSNAYARRLGWEAPTPVFSWTVPTDELRDGFDGAGFEISHGGPQRPRLIYEDLASRWNRPWRRPSWWEPWQREKHPGLTSYQFHRPGQQPTGMLSVAFEDHPAEGRRLVVHDFWATSGDEAQAMFAFLGRHSSRISSVAFQRTGLPSAPMLLHRLRRSGSLAARAWHPWMLRVLNLAQAVRLRGWADEADLALPIEVVTEDGAATEPFMLRVAGGKGELSPTTREGRLTLTRGQFAVWYAGGYRSATAAALAGVRGDPRSIAQLLLATADREPWLPDHF